MKISEDSDLRKGTANACDVSKTSIPCRNSKGCDRETDKNASGGAKGEVFSLLEVEG